jgi:hypothetical protein
MLVYYSNACCSYLVTVCNCAGRFSSVLRQLKLQNCVIYTRFAHHCKQMLRKCSVNRGPEQLAHYRTQADSCKHN